MNRSKDDNCANPINITINKKQPRTNQAHQNLELFSLFFIETMLHNITIPSHHMNGSENAIVYPNKEIAINVTDKGKAIPPKYRTITYHSITQP